MQATTSFMECFAGPGLFYHEKITKFQRHSSDIGQAVLEIATDTSIDFLHLRCISIHLGSQTPFHLCKPHRPSAAENETELGAKTDFLFLQPSAAP